MGKSEVVNTVIIASIKDIAAQTNLLALNASIEAVEKGMVIADETAKLLESIVEGSKTTTEEVNRIAATMEEDAVTIDEINKGIRQINEVVQNNSATSQECAAASQEMSEQANSLKDSIRKFTVA